MRRFTAVVERDKHTLYVYGESESGFYAGEVPETVVYINEIWLEHRRPCGTGSLSWHRRLCKKAEQNLIADEGFNEQVEERLRER